MHLATIALVIAAHYRGRYASDGRGFFIEVGVDNAKGQAVVLRSFNDSEALEDYAQYLLLPDL